jgi:hypothetical protein
LFDHSIKIKRTLRKARRIRAGVSRPGDRSGGLAGAGGCMAGMRRRFFLDLIPRMHQQPAASIAGGSRGALEFRFSKQRLTFGHPRNNPPSPSARGPRHCRADEAGNRGPTTAHAVVLTWAGMKDL